MPFCAVLDGRVRREDASEELVSVPSRLSLTRMGVLGSGGVRATPSAFSLQVGSGSWKPPVMRRLIVDIIELPEMGHHRQLVRPRPAGVRLQATRAQQAGIQ